MLIVCNFRAYITGADPEVFELLFNWLYRRILTRISKDDEEDAMYQVELYMKLYFEAEKFETHDLQNSILDTFRARPTCADGWFPDDIISAIYEDTKTPALLRRYVVDTPVFKAYHWDFDGHKTRLELEEQLLNGNREFVIDCSEALLKLVMARKKVQDPNKKEACTYHVHERGEMCK